MKSGLQSENSTQWLVNGREVLLLLWIMKDFHGGPVVDSTLPTQARTCSLSYHTDMTMDQINEPLAALVHPFLVSYLGVSDFLPRNSIVSLSYIIPWC